MSASVELVGPACRICGASGRLLITRLRQTDVYRCAFCDFVFCDPLPTLPSFSSSASSILTDEKYTQAMCSLSAKVLDRYRQLARSRDEQYRRSLRSRIQAERARPCTYRLLEIGCGAAGLADELKRLGVDYRGLDIDHRPVLAARARGVSGVEIGDFMSLPVPSRPYDVICLSQVLEHIKTPVDFIDRIHSWLAPGGVLHLDVPHHLSLSGVVAMAMQRAGLARRQRFGGIKYPHHSFSYRRRTLCMLLRRGFDARVFTASPEDPLWGQAVVPRLPLRAYYFACRLLRLQPLLVGYGIRI